MIRKRVGLIACILLSMAVVSYAVPDGDGKPHTKKKFIMKKKADASAPEAKTQSEPKKEKTSLAMWLERMKKRTARAQSKHSQLVAVGAVRGEKISDTVPLYWKGKSNENSVPLAELKEFDEAIDLASKGDKANAKVKLEAFVAAHPKSSLASDAQDTLKLINEE